MSDMNPTANSRDAPAGWIDLREPAARAAKAAKPARTSMLDVDGGAAFSLFLVMLFIPQLDTAGPALFVLISVAYGAWRARQLSAILRPRAFLLVIPAIAVLSCLWSDEPLLSIKYSLEFALTIMVALILSAAPRPKGVIEGIFLAFAVHIFASFALGQAVVLGNNGDTAFAGLNDSKNLLADEAATGFMTTLAVFVIGLEDGKSFRCVAAVLAAAIQIYVILAARSAGAIVGVVGASLVFLILLVLRNTSFMVRSSALGVTALFLSSAALAYGTLSDVFVDIATRYFEKDMTFTGRTYLWERAADLIHERPLLGRGYHAFWLQGNPDAEGLWRYLGIRNEYGFNFHNTFVELLVHFGGIGLFLFGICFVVGLAFLVLRFVRLPNLALCFWLSIIVYEAVRMPIETVIPGEFSISTILILTGLGLALGQAPVRAPSPTRQAWAARGV